MKLEIFNKVLRTRMEMIRAYNFVQYTDEFNGPGSFTITIPTTEESIKYLNEDNFILFEDGIVGVIRYFGYSRDDRTTIQIKGYLTNGILNRRSFLLTSKYYDTLSNVSRQMVEDLIISPEDVVRRIDFIKLSELEQYTPESDKVRVQATGDKLGEFITKTFLPYGFGYELYPKIENYNAETDTLSNLSYLEYRVLKPKDRTIGNEDGNSPVVFSFELNNLSKLDYESDSTNYCSIAIVASEGEGQERKVIEVGESEKTGFDRIELYVDARDLQSENSDGTTITDEELEQLMKQRGLEKLTENKRFISFDGTITEGNISYKYKEDFYKGDYVSIIDKELNRVFDIQISAVTKSISNGVEYLDIEFGYDKLKINKIFKNKVGVL